MVTDRCEAAELNVVSGTEQPAFHENLEYQI